MLLWQPDVLHWLLFSLVIWGERLLPLPFYLHPLSIFHSLAMRMAKRVHPSCARSRTQQRISGLMAPMVLITPWLVIAALIYWLSPSDWLFAALLLFISLRTHSAIRDHTSIQQALELQQKQLAREFLQPYVARDSKPLSLLGIRKASIEWLPRYWVESWLGVIFWFLLAGPVVALGYRMLIDLQRAWPASQQHWRDFAAPVAAFAQIASWPAFFLYWLLLALRQLLSGKVLPWSFTAQRWITAPEGRLLRALSMRLKCRLGGPVFLDGIKRQRPRFQYGNEPENKELQATRRLLLHSQITCWLLLSPLFLLGFSSF
ncbi:hypothetical protein CWE09_07170 [Aliidiomarina minuta]|uniref:Cobalamin biosynthesis protein CbiB n=1 Tax=Aliidiomarina minuta TaxID=880057 RepID=A0A432W8V5_9GAMM|nr:cobalamin biosynthesis protein [Aliidiomarina minuta]RUO26481.1 hypothetical protein CWE09_07170 [Aliidiomarina minuta]